jgi:uncharacterized protein with PhoU and TrkA domain
MELPKWKEAEFEEIEYEPTTIKELLSEMKDTSELMIDLAYSAILFNDREIAEEVKYLEVRMDKLNYQIRMMAMLAARTTEEAEQLAGILQIAEAAESISNAAGDMVKLLSMKLNHPILPRIFKESDEKICRMKIDGASNACSKSISSLKIESEAGVRIVAIRRKNRWIYGPGGAIILRAEDSVIGKGTDEGLARLQKFFKGKMEVLE